MILSFVHIMLSDMGNLLSFQHTLILLSLFRCEHLKHMGSWTTSGRIRTYKYFFSFYLKIIIM